MNHLDDHADNELTRHLRDSLSDITVAERPGLGEIVSHGRAHRRRRILGTAGAGVVGVAAVGAVTLGLTGALGGTAVAPAGNTIRETAFTLTANSNGTATLTLNRHEALTPAALQRALAADGITAIATTENPRDPGQTAACHFLPQDVTGKAAGAVSGTHNQNGELQTLVINPAAVPAGTELFFGYINVGGQRFLTWNLAEDGCSVPSGN